MSIKCSDVIISMICVLACAAAIPAARAGTETVLHSFCSETDCTDGRVPFAGLIDVNGVLYGTTSGGGEGETDSGTVFSLDLSTGVEQALYSFCSATNCDDGRDPEAGVIDVKGALYGTTSEKGANCPNSYGCGTAFSVEASTGSEQTLYSFCSEPKCADGQDPVAGVIDVKGALYGTTYSGGAKKKGAVFSVDAVALTEKVLYSFCSKAHCKDGQNPAAGVIDVKGALYGTTAIGGANDEGAVFSVDASTGAEKVLYSFCSRSNCRDGSDPEAGVIHVNGVLYSTTALGGAGDAGTVFSFDPSTGVETVLYSFCSQAGCADGSTPLAGVIDVNGVLYGTTTNGGANNAGMVFSVDAHTGAETVLYSFCSQAGCADGSTPLAGVIDVNGALYGTTWIGGMQNEGTVFSVTP
jgi:uncharacterized repeat protein (TIGR03803 family)